MTDPELAVIKKDFTEFLILDLEGTTKDDVFRNIADFVKDKGLVRDAEIPYQKFLQYYRLRIPLMGNGIMAPEAHGIDMARPYAFILCRTRAGLDLYTTDQVAVRIILFTLVGNKKNLSRLKPMTRFVRALQSKAFLEEFLNAKTDCDAYEALAKYGISH
jgi:mannitol/fructose-specific phosphotransferase system IIA component (Ntr-type)